MADARMSLFLDKEEIRELLYIYCRGVDRSDSDILASVFTPEARVEYGLFNGTVPEFCEFALSFVADIGPSHHNVTNTIIRVSGDRAVGESYGIAVHGDMPGPDGRVDLIVFVRYNDRFERRDGAWKIAHRQVIYEWNQTLPLTASWDGPVSSQYWPRGLRSKDDVTYMAQP